MDSNDLTTPEFCQFWYFTHLEHILKTNIQALRRYTETYSHTDYAMYGETVHPTCQANWAEKFSKN